jgi:extradiol dioxygenase family protein
MNKAFHLSIGVKSIENSVEFFEGLLGDTVTHRDVSGYVNLELFGSQITLKENKTINPELPDFHFGFNMNLDEFDQLANRVLKSGRVKIYMEPKVVDPGTHLERKKMYLKCPTGYLVELKGYRS